jgi:hypothetical protein
VIAALEITRFNIVLVFAAGAGLFTFFNGFRAYRKYRVVDDTPLSTIRSVPMGLVRVRGKASGDNTIWSPLTRQRCFLYRVEIERWEEDYNRKSTGWKHYRTDLQGAPFFLIDATGRILVDPVGAEQDLVLSAEKEVSSGYSKSLSSIFSRSSENARMAPVKVTETEILKYITTVQTSSVSSLLNSGSRIDQTSEALRRLLANPFPGRTASTQVNALRRALEDAGTQADPHKEVVRQAMLRASMYPPTSPEFAAHMRRAEVAQGEIHPQNYASVAVADPEEEQAPTFLAPPAEGRYRLAEYCILPGHYYDVTGTCSENPHSINAMDRNIITQGQNEPTFLISWRTVEGVEKKLRNRAAAMILGGGAIVIATLGFLLTRIPIH